MIPTRLSLPAAATTALLLAAAAAPLHAAIYTNDFNGTDAASRFTNEFNVSSAGVRSSGDASWTVVDGVYRNTMSSATDGTNVSSTASFSTAGVAGNNFSISVQFKATQITNSTSTAQTTVGFGLFSDTPDFTSDTAAGRHAYFVDYVMVAGNTATEGNLRIVRDGTLIAGTTGLADPNTSSSSLAVVINTTYTLRLVGEYNAQGHLTLTWGLFDAAGTNQIGTSSTYTDETPLTGEYFGLRNRLAGVNGSPSYTVDFDNYALIPEPSTALLAIPGALVLLRRRRAC